MTRLRFIVDRPRGKRGGHNDERYLFKSLYSATGSAESKKGAEYNGHVIRADRPAGRVLTIDIDALLPVDASLEDQRAYHERQMLHHMTEMLRLDHHWVGDAPVLTTTDMALIREAVSEWHAEEDRLRRGGGATPAAAGAFFLMRDLWRSGKLG